VKDVAMRAVVLGAGPTGCAAALHLAASAADVTLIDREDVTERPLGADQVFDSWDRRAVGQFRQPHNFLGLGRQIIREHFPMVYEQLGAAGATEIHQDAFLGDAPRQPDDDLLATIACRRPVIDAVWHNAVANASSVTFRSDAVVALRVRDGAGPPHVHGVELGSGETIDADVVVDATGRGSAVQKWLRAANVPAWDEEANDSGLLYYSRHYRFVGDPPPHVSLLGGPRGDTGYLAFATFLGDSATFCLCIMAPAWQNEWRVLRNTDAFERVARMLPGAAPWLDTAAPITDVLPMGQLRNTLRHPVDATGGPVVTGLIPIGDARCHTNPTFAFGLSLGLRHAVSLGPALANAADDAAVISAFEAAVGDDARTRFAAVSAEDRDRVRLWSGKPIDVSDRSDSMPLFIRTVVTRAALRDATVLRALCRRVNVLDPIDALAADDALLDRAERLAADVPMPVPPPRDGILAALHG
jgi:flavin-dependent dehydrogenase